MDGLFEPFLDDVKQLKLTESSGNAPDGRLNGSTGPSCQLSKYNQPMKIELSSEQRPSAPLVIIEMDPARVRGSRSAFGPMLHLGVQIMNESKHYPTLFEGMFKWVGEAGGITIPLQSIARGTSELLVPVSDHQVAAIERVRAGRASDFHIDLRAVGTPDSDGIVGRYTTNFVPQLQIPRDVWKRALDGCGVGAVRIIELPAPVAGAGQEWARAFEQVDVASRFLSEGRYGEAVATARMSLERIAEGVGSSLGRTRNEGEYFATYLDRITSELRERKRGSDPFALIGQLIRTANGWMSHPVHQGFDTSERDDALFAVNLCVAVYSYLARSMVGIPQPQTDSENAK